MLTASALNTRPAHPCSPGPSPTPHKQDAFGSQTTSPFGFGPPLSSSPEGLTSKRPWSARPLRSSPTTEPSPLLRAGPSLCPASVLCRSRFVPFAVLPLADRVAPRPHQRPDQHRDYRFSCSMPAPATGSRHLYTGHRQDNTQVASWLRARHHRRPFVPETQFAPGFDAIFRISVRQQWFTHVRLPIAHLTR